MSIHTFVNHFSRVGGEIGNRSYDPMPRKIGADAWFYRRPDLTPTPLSEKINT
jgi:hypothetical protein